jgi:hypothetical protein
VAKAAEYAPKIRAIIEGSSDGDGITVNEIAKQVKCSTQQVYKVLGQLGTKKQIVGQSPTGAYLYRYDPNGEETPRGFERKAGRVAGQQGAGKGHARKRGQARKAVLQINELVTIKGIRARDDELEVELENEAGDRITVVVENRG